VTKTVCPVCGGSGCYMGDSRYWCDCNCDNQRYTARHEMETLRWKAEEWKRKCDTHETCETCPLSMTGNDCVLCHVEDALDEARELRRG
jgi:hypothetical protein